MKIYKFDKMVKEAIGDETDCKQCEGWGNVCFPDDYPSYISDPKSCEYFIKKEQGIKEQLVDEIRELTRKMDKMVDENFGYAPDSNQFDSYLDERGKKLEELKALDSELWIKMIDEI